MKTIRQRVLEASGQLEWVGRRMMEFRTAVLMVNWMDEEGLCDPAQKLDPIKIAKRFTAGPKSKARTVFEKAMRAAMDGLFTGSRGPSPKTSRKGSQLRKQGRRK